MRNDEARCAAIQNSKFKIQNLLIISTPKIRFFSAKPGFWAKERAFGAGATRCVGQNNVLRFPEHRTVSVWVELFAKVGSWKCKQIVSDFGVSLKRKRRGRTACSPAWWWSTPLGSRCLGVRPKMPGVRARARTPGYRELDAFFNTRYAGRSVASAERSVLALRFNFP